MNTFPYGGCFFLKLICRIRLLLYFCNHNKRRQFSQFVGQEIRQFSWLECRPVTAEVAGSSPVRIAKISQETKRFFVFKILVDHAQNGSRTKLGDYAKICVNLNKKNFRSFTPRSCNLKFFIFALKDSADAFVLLFIK